MQMLEELKERLQKYLNRVEEMRGYL